MYSKIAVVSVVTDVLISLLYHYEETWKTTSDQLQLWWITKSGDVKVVYPLHNICHKLVNIKCEETNVIKVLPDIHSLTRRDTVSKLGSKVAATKLVHLFYLLQGFGSEKLTEDMISNVELVTFHELRFEFCHKSMSNIDLEKLPCSSDVIK